MSQLQPQDLYKKQAPIEAGVSLKVFQVESDEHKQQVRELLGEYLQWLHAMSNAEFGVDFDVRTTLEQDMAGLVQFAPPAGCLLLAEYEGQSVGLAGMRKLNDDRGDIGELKRTYVRPEFRGLGIGRALLEGVIARAQQVGYSVLRLESAPSLKPAYALYRAVGFREIDAYYRSEGPQEFHAHSIFMELSLPQWAVEGTGGAGKGRVPSQPS
jgi:ribosomal protein S18 acetylase RimI-like enzyme